MNKSQQTQHILELIKQYGHVYYVEDDEYYADKVLYPALEKVIKTLVNQNYASRKALRTCEVQYPGTRHAEMYFEEDYVKKALKLFGEEYKGDDK